MHATHTLTFSVICENSGEWQLDTSGSSHSPLGPHLLRACPEPAKAAKSAHTRVRQNGFSIYAYILTIFHRNAELRFHGPFKQCGPRQHPVRVGLRWTGGKSCRHREQERASLLHACYTTVCVCCCGGEGGGCLTCTNTRVPCA